MIQHYIYYNILDSSCHKSCDLIGWNQISKALRSLPIEILTEYHRSGNYSWERPLTMLTLISSACACACACVLIFVAAIDYENIFTPKIPDLRY